MSEIPHLNVNNYDSANLTLENKLREHVREAFLENLNREVLDKSEMKTLWGMLEAKFGFNSYMDYKSFLEIKEAIPEKSRKFFKPSVFGRLVTDDIHCHVSVRDFFDYVMKTSWCLQTRIGLSLYDSAGDGFLREDELESYIAEIVPTLGGLPEIEAKISNLYLFAAVRKFFFFLDTTGSNKIKITDIIASGFLDDFLMLSGSQEVSQSTLESNWFSYQCFMRHYENYMTLDSDGSGLLSISDFSQFNDGSLNRIFIERLFQVVPTYSNELDFKGYIQFVLANDNKLEPQSIAYFFRILDMGNSKCICGQTVRYFFNGILASLNASEESLLSEVVCEIFDIVNPKNPDYFTQEDLILCGKADTVIGILIDVQKYLMHENRESYPSNEPEEAQI